MQEQQEVKTKLRKAMKILFWIMVFLMGVVLALAAYRFL